MTEPSTEKKKGQGRFRAALGSFLEFFKRFSLTNIKTWANDYVAVVRKTSWPDLKFWFGTYWRISLILLVSGLILFGVEWVLLKAILGFQGILPESSSVVLAGIYLFFLLFAGVVAVAFILLQKGSGEGASAMFGAGVQTTGAGSVTASKRIVQIAWVSGVVFVILVLFAPTTLGALI